MDSEGAHELQQALAAAKEAKEKKEKNRADPQPDDRPELQEPILQDVKVAFKAQSQAQRSPGLGPVDVGHRVVDARRRGSAAPQTKEKPRILSNVRKQDPDQEDRTPKDEEEEEYSMHTGAVQSFAKIVIILLLMALIFITVSCNNLALVSFKEHLSNPIAIGQLFLMLTLPALPVGLASFCTMLVREGKTHSTEKQLSGPVVLFLSLVEALVSASTECTFVFYVLPKAHGAVTLLLLGIAWNAGPLVMLLLSRDSFKNGSNEYTPIGFTIGSRIMQVCTALGLLCTIVALVFAVVSSKLWWEVPLIVAIGSFAHWENFVPLIPVPVQRSLSNCRFSMSFYRELFRVTAVLLLFMLYAWKNFDIGVATFFKAIGDSAGSDTERAFYLHIATGFVGYFAAWLGNLVFWSRLGVGLPLLLSTPVCVILHETLLAEKSRWFFGILFAAVPLDGVAKSLTPAGVVLGAVGSCFALYYFFHNRTFSLVVLLSEKDLFSRPGYEPFLQQSLSLNALRGLRFKNPSKSKWSSSDPFKHKTFVLATMWHEGEEEMTEMIKSLVALAKQSSGSDREQYETHIVFDDAIKNDDANQYVQTLFRVLRDAELHIEDPVETWYGYLVNIRMPGHMALNVHLKNVTLVKQKKRWSQNLAIEVILTSMAGEPLERFEQTYLLLLDGDTRFSKKDVDILRGRLVEDPDRVGAVCGRIVPDVAPENTNPIVWYQKFEYAASHWLQKASEHVFGSVFCCPGCFTLVRFSALVRRAGNPKWSEWEDTPLAVYNREAESAMDVLMLEQGEDRMLSTQLVRNGWLLQYCSDAVAVTFCPDSFDGFFTQRRRWNTSTVANIYYLLAEAGTILTRNGSISLPYIISTLISLLVMIIGPAMIIVITVGAITYGLRVNAVAGAIIGILIPALYTFICIVFHIDMSDPNPKKKLRKFDIQTGAAFIFTGFYMVIMGVVLIGIFAQLVHSVVESEWTPDIMYVILVFIIYGLAAILHGEGSMLLHMPIYLLLTPTMSLLLPIFCIMNLHDMSWGTRDSAGKESVVVKEDLGFWKFGWRNLKELFCRAPGGIEFTPAGRWLAEQNLSEYIPNFAAQGYDTVESLATVLPENYEQIGIKLGHRAQLRSAITKLSSSLNAEKKAEPIKTLLRQEEQRKIRRKKEQELTALFLLVPNYKLRDFLKRLHGSLKFSTVDTQRQKTELADLQKKAGFSVLTITFVVLAVTIVFSSNFGNDPFHWGFLKVYPARLPGYVIVLAYSLLMITQFIGMLLYRFGIFLYTFSRWRIQCTSSIFIGEDTVRPTSTGLTPSNSSGSISSLGHSVSREPTPTSTNPISHV